MLITQNNPLFKAIKKLARLAFVVGRSPAGRALRCHAFCSLRSQKTFPLQSLTRAVLLR